MSAAATNLLLTLVASGLRGGAGAIHFCITNLVSICTTNLIITFSFWKAIPKKVHSFFKCWRRLHNQLLHTVEDMAIVGESLQI